MSEALLVYLAGPIDGIPVEEAKNWRELAMRELAKLGHAAYNPVGSCYVPPSLLNDQRVCGVVSGLHRHALALCDVVIANLQGPGRAFGTIREIEAARAMNKPVWVVGEVVSLEAWDVNVVVELYDAIDGACKPTTPTWAL